MGPTRDPLHSVVAPSISWFNPRTLDPVAASVPQEHPPLYLFKKATSLVSPHEHPAALALLRRALPHLFPPCLPRPEGPGACLCLVSDIVSPAYVFPDYVLLLNENTMKSGKSCLSDCRGLPEAGPCLLHEMGGASLPWTRPPSSVPRPGERGCACRTLLGAR